MSDEKNPAAEEMNDEPFTLVLTDQKTGEETEFEYLDSIEYKNKEYIVLLPTEGDEMDQVIIFEVEPLDEENETYKDVESQEVLDAVFEIFKERNAEEFNFVD